MMWIKNKKYRILLLSVSLLFALGCAPSTKIKPFTSDDCSCWPEGYDNQNQWEECCREHDLAYWAGGSREDRLRADEKLRECVEQVGDTAIARVMYVGVRVGGSALLPFPWRWGYGWPFLRGYGPLTEKEQRMVDIYKKEAQKRIGRENEK